MVAVYSGLDLAFVDTVTPATLYSYTVTAINRLGSVASSETNITSDEACRWNLLFHSLILLCSP